MSAAGRVGRFLWSVRRQALLVSLLALIGLPGLGSPEAGTHPDEALYLAIGAQMADRGAWLDATLDGEPDFHKPPLLYWAQHLFHLLFGTSLFAGRLPSALAGIALALVVGGLARRLYGESAEWPAALFTASCAGVSRFSRLAMMDVPLAFFIALAAYGAFRAAEERRPPLLLLCGVAAGGALLLKGPVGVLIILLLAAGYLAVRLPGLLAGRWTLASFALGAALGLPWFLFSWARHGAPFFESFFLREHGYKFSGPWTVEGEASLFAALALLSSPWLLLAVGGSWRLWRWREPGLLLPLLWLGSVLLVYSLPSEKQAHYVLPSLPAAMLLASGRMPPRWASAVTSLALGLGGVLVLLLLRWPLPAASLASCLLSAGGFFTSAALLFRSRLAPAAAAVGLGTMLLIGVALPLASPPLISAEAKERLPGRPVFLFNLHGGVYRFAAGKVVHRAWAEEDLSSALSSGAAVILTEEELKALSLERQRQWSPLARWRRLRRAVPPETAWRAWRTADLSPLLEEVVLLGGAGPPP
ncbi:MAG: glycosyltransferase family 39 protein [Myxococcales bacterium]|nr:glycosyltransferase family 39 protein [Myxococcales bacterium]